MFIFIQNRPWLVTWVTHGILTITINMTYICLFPVGQGWSGGGKVLGKRSVPGHPTCLDDSRARAYCACGRCGLFGHFFSHLSFQFSFSISLGDGQI